MNFDENYVISNYFEICEKIAKNVYKVQFVLFKDTEYTWVDVAYNFISKDKKLMKDYRDTLALIIVQFSGYFDISVSEEAKLLSKEEIEINLNYILNRFVEKHKLIYTKLDFDLFIGDIKESLKLTSQEEEYFNEDFQDNFAEWYEDVIKEIVKNNLYSTNEMFSNVSEYIDYCFYKDLDGMYCEKCKNWLAYGIEDKSEWYIISDDLIACPECVKARNGKYRWLSDFSLIRYKWLQDPEYTCDNFIRAIRTPFLKKIYTGYNSIRLKTLTRKYILDQPDFYKMPFKHEILSNKVKKDIKKIYKGPDDEIVAYHVCVDWLYYTPEIYQLFKDRFEYNLWYKFIFIKEFGTLKDKNKFYKRLMKEHNVFKILKHYTFDDFYDYGYYILEQEHFVVTSGKLNEFYKSSKHFREFELLMLENGDPYELTQMYHTNELYIAN